MTEQQKNAITLEMAGESVGRLTLNQPETRNSLSLAMLELLDQRLQAVSADASIRVLIIAAAGPVFCAGHNLREVQGQLGDSAAQLALFRRCSEVMQRLVALPKPVIAQVQGVATAAGCQLVASCDLAVAGVNTRFATPGVNIGLFCSTPMVALTRNVHPKHAMEMLLTGEMITAHRAEQIGLVNRVVDDELLAEETLKLALLIASKSSRTLAIGKEAFYRQGEMSLADAYDWTSEVMAKNLETQDAREGICAFVEKRPPQWRGE
ncbi:enoyl-CoA hydratase [Marinospirillum alkaliphilum]|uniref:Enoyl-CoA hydratase domain-containing protein 3, mitochondrial n=1 Tax=Marinospirillum alkaliphilum DSM 21637 TaxID=1122209 RepID=A0A1K1Z924_9GAMM|nr:enoyl-CoA hydratase [Marinospirillum alkaliphilum]SFX70689.1 Enoyl-CoA hydratase/carnithine racemase [Marinospirillum alkaliphilum DSM 21637]